MPDVVCVSVYLCVCVSVCLCAQHYAVITTSLGWRRTDELILIWDTGTHWTSRGLEVTRPSAGESGGVEEGK
uniref:Putative secreted protein n=1 Tax=Anopheles darlingi TaxID=43151 RepID=A0A2M4DA99_ANODA